MASYHPNPSTQRSATNARDPSRAMQHYNDFNERQRGPVYTQVEEMYTPPRPSGREFLRFADYDYNDLGARKTSSTTVEEVREDFDDEKSSSQRGYRRPHPNGDTLQNGRPSPQSPYEQSPSDPRTPQRGRQRDSQGPLDIIIPSMFSQSAHTVNSFFIAYFTAMLSLGTLGSSITFNYVLNDSIREPSPSSRFGKPRIQDFLALAWLFFVLDLAFTAACQTLLKFYSRRLEAEWDAGGRRRSRTQSLGLVIAAILLVLVILAFIFLSLIVTAYSSAVGFVALAFTCLAGLGGLMGIAYQAPILRRGKQGT